MLLFMDGFDRYTPGELDSNQVRGKWGSWHMGGALRGSIVSPGRGGVGRCLKNQDSTLAQADVRSTPLAIAGTTVIVGFWVNWSGWGGPLAALFDGGTQMCTISVNGAGQISVTGGYTSTAGVFLNTWTHVEVKVDLSDSVGTVDCRINGVSAGTPVAGADTIAAGSAADVLVLFPNQGPRGTMIDDVVLCDGSGSAFNDFVGPVAIHTRSPTADEAVAWTPQGAGANYVEVDEDTPDEDTTHVEATAAGVEDFFTHAGDLTGNIIAVGVIARAKDADVSSLSMRTKLKSNGTEADGPTLGLNTDYGYVWSVHEVDPDTGVAWTLGGANAVAFGYETV